MTIEPDGFPAMGSALYLFYTCSSGAIAYGSGADDSWG